MKLTADPAAPWPAAAASASTTDREMITTVAVTTTWRVEGKRLVAVPAAEHWPVTTEPLIVGAAHLGVDLDHRRVLTDLLVLGEARTPGGRPLPKLVVRAACGQLTHQTTVFGDRHWHRGLLGWRMSEPLPFATLPLTNDRAFGGVAVLDGEAAPHPTNPIGRGFHLSTAALRDAPLPNLERPDQLITAWTDRPIPALWYKGHAMLPPTDGTAGDVTAAIAALTPQLFSDAIPALCAPWSAFGREVLLEGFLASGPLSLPLPTAPPASVRVQIGNHRSRFTLIPRRIVALPGPAALVVTWATSFRWLFNPLDARAMSLDWNRP